MRVKDGGGGSFFFLIDEHVPLFFLGLTPGSPVVFEVVCGFFGRGRPDALAVTAPDEVDEKPVEEVRHVVLFLAGPAFAKTLDKENGLQNPEIGLGGEAGIGKDLGAEHVVDTHLRLFC